MVCVARGPQGQAGSHAPDMMLISLRLPATFRTFLLERMPSPTMDPPPDAPRKLREAVR